MSEPQQRVRRAWPEVLWASLQLGLSSFGGPIAHLGYFQRSYVRRRGWLSPDEFAALVALCQVLPGPTSSQVGLLVGYRRAGWQGALAACVGFTLPSALLMYGFARLAASAPVSTMPTIVHGLLLAAVAVVAQAVWNMARQLCPDRQRSLIALGSTLLLLLNPSTVTQLAVMTLGAAGGAILCRDGPASTGQLGGLPGARSAIAALIALVALMIGLPIAARAWPHGAVALADLLARDGALVFGGGHVVLPLLRESLVPAGWLSDSSFLTGYGFAQAVPGPLFSVAAYVGAAAAPAAAAPVWALVALAAIFAPGLLLALSGSWILSRLGGNSGVRGVLAGINAAVVGILGAALYHPVITSAIRSFLDALLVVAAFWLLQRWRMWPLLIVALCVAMSFAQAAAVS